MPNKANDTGEQKAWRGALTSIKQLKAFDVRGKTVMDIGANVGHITQYLCEACAGRVIAYEPHPTSFAALKTRCSGFTNAELNNVALLTKPGELLIAESKKDADFGYHCNARLAIPGAKQRANWTYLPIKVVSFSKEMARIRPNGIKIDTEGSEYDLLLQNEMPEKVDWLCVEFHFLNAIGWPLFAAVVERLNKQGFKMHILSPKMRPAAGKIASFWGFEVINFSRTAMPNKEDWEWIQSLLQRASTERVHSIHPHLQTLFDNRYINYKK